MKFLALAVILCLSVALSHQKKKYIKDKGSFIESCEQQPIDLGIVLDSSRSIRKTDFEKTKKFIHDFLDFFEIGKGHDDVKVSMIPFGHGIYPEAGWGLNDYTKKSALLDKVMNIAHQFGDRTDTGDALEYLADKQFTRKFIRKHAEQMVVVITDGNSQLAKRTAEMAKKARDQKITVFAVGIGNVRGSELLNIAGSMDRVTKVKNFDSLDSVKGILRKKTCIKKKKTTTTAAPTTTMTTPAPNTQSCSEEDPVDLNFAFSAADLGIDHTAWTTSFISNVVDAKPEPLQAGTLRYGVISGSCPLDAGFALDTYNNADAIKERLMGYDRIKLPLLAQQASTSGFTPANGGRPDSRKVTVLVAGATKKGVSLEREVSQLVAQGIEVFIANPTGQQVNVQGAISLFGGNPLEQANDLVSLLCP